MKKLLLLGLAIVLFTACEEKGPVRWTATAPEIDVAKALIKDYEDANWESWTGHYADTAKIFHNSLTGITSQELQDGFKAQNANHSSYGFEEENRYYERIIDDKGEIWVYFWGTWEGTLKASGKELKLPVHLALRFVDNKIVREFGYYDTSPIIAALNEAAAAEMMETDKDSIQ